MKPENPSPPPTEPQPEEKQPWVPPTLNKMDIQETAISQGTNLDGDGFS